MSYSMAIHHGTFILPGYSPTEMKFDRTELVRYGEFEIELCFFDDMGPAPVTFVVRVDAGDGCEKFGKFVVREEDGGVRADVLKTTSIWRDSYVNTMPLDEFLKKTLG